MKKIKGLIFLVLLFLLIGAVSATDDANDTFSTADESVALEQDAGDVISMDDDSYYDDDYYDDDYYDDDSYYDDESDYEEYSDLYVTPGKTTYSGTAGNKITVSVTVRDYWSDNPVKNADVTFKINGHTYTATTNSKGVASVSFKLPASQAKTTSKTKGSILTKTTTYSKTYTCDVYVEADGYYSDSTSFNVKSTKAKVVKKYKVNKKKKTYTIKVKNGYKIYKKAASYNIETYKFSDSGYTYILSAMSKKSSSITFYLKHHYKKNGKWKWTSWRKVGKGYYNIYRYTSGIKVDKLKFRYTQVTYKRIS